MVAILVDGRQDVAVGRFFAGIQDYWEALCKRHDMPKRAVTSTTQSKATSTSKSTKTSTNAKTSTTAKAATTTTKTSKTTAHTATRTSTTSTDSSSSSTSSTSSFSSTNSASTITSAPAASGSWVPSYSVLGDEVVSAYVNSAGQIVSVAYLGSDGRMTIVAYASTTTQVLAATTTDSSDSTVLASATASSTVSADSSANGNNASISHKSSHAGMIVGIVLGLAVVFILIFVLFRHRRSRLLRPLFKNINQGPSGRVPRATSADSLLEAAAAGDRSHERHLSEKQMEAEPAVLRATTAPSAAAISRDTYRQTSVAPREGRPLTGQRLSSVILEETASAVEAAEPRPRLPQSHPRLSQAQPRPPSDSCSTLRSNQNHGSTNGSFNSSADGSTGAPTYVSHLKPAPVSVSVVARRSLTPESRRALSPISIQRRHEREQANSIGHKLHVPLSPMPPSTRSHVALNLATDHRLQIQGGEESDRTSADGKRARAASLGATSLGSVSLGGISIASSALASPGLLPWPLPPQTPRVSVVYSESEDDRATSQAGSSTPLTQVASEVSGAPSTASFHTASQTAFTSSTARTSTTAVTVSAQPATISQHVIPRKPLAPTAKTPSRPALSGPGSRNLLQAQAAWRWPNHRPGVDLPSSPPPMEALPPPPGMAPPRSPGLVFHSDSSSIMVRVPISRFNSVSGRGDDRK